MKWPTWWTVLLISLALCGQANAQTGNADIGGSDTAEPGALDSLTLDEILAKATDAIDRAERRGEDSYEALREGDRLVNSILARDPANVRGGYLRARVLILAGRPTEATQLIQKWIQSPRGQNDWKALKLLADLYRLGKFPTLAVARYLEAARLNPSEPSIYVGLASSYSALGRNDKAAQAAADAVNADLSNDPAIRSHLVTSLLQGERIKEARREAVKVVTRTRALVQASPSNANLLVELDERIDVLLSIIIQQLVADPNQPDEYVRAAELSLDRATLAHQLAYHQALAHINVGISKVGGDTPPSLRYARAQLLARIGRQAEAVTELEAILQTQPDHAKARALLLELEGGDDEASAEAP